MDDSTEILFSDKVQLQTTDNKEWTPAKVGTLTIRRHKISSACWLQLTSETVRVCTEHAVCAHVWTRLNEHARLAYMCQSCVVFELLFWTLSQSPCLPWPTEFCRRTIVRAFSDSHDHVWYTAPMHSTGTLGTSKRAAAPSGNACSLQ